MGLLLPHASPPVPRSIPAGPFQITLPLQEAPLSGAHHTLSLAGYQAGVASSRQWRFMQTHNPCCSAIWDASRSLPAHLSTRLLSLVTVAGRRGALRDGSGVSTARCWYCDAAGAEGQGGGSGFASTPPAKLGLRPPAAAQPPTAPSAAHAAAPQAVPTCDSMLLLNTILLAM